LTDKVIYESNWLGESDNKTKYKVFKPELSDSYYIAELESYRPNKVKIIIDGLKTKDDAMKKIEALEIQQELLHYRKKKTSKSKSKRKPVKKVVRKSKPKKK
jgi:hypothetical protein